MVLYHGSKLIVDRPLFQYGKINNDYGQGFYCSEDIELAREWSCQDPEGGFVSCYRLDTADLKILEIDNKSIIPWLALLLSSRIVRYSSPLEKNISEYIVSHFLPDVSRYDVIRGFRADDSYFTMARAFLSNTISLEQLAVAMKLGGFGIQVCLKSRRSFELIDFTRAEPVDGDVYYLRRINRDNDARQDFYKLMEQGGSGGIFARDILVKEMTEDELLIQ